MDAINFLIDRLIKKGWKPRWYEDVYEFKLYKLWYTIARPQKQKMISFATETRHYINWTDYIWYKWYSLRELVSKESWLRQFVCEKEFLKEEFIQGDYINSDYSQPSFRLCECAMKDETDLESFLLENIKI